MDISFVIPVYKTPKRLLAACLESVCSIRNAEIEIICVVDSPGENCEKVIEEIARSDSRIKVVKNDRNRGAAYSRNKALGIATGEFVSFVDSDDTIEHEVYEEMFKVATRRKLSACSCKAVGQKRYCGVEYGKWGFERSPCTHAFQMGAWAALWRSTCIKSNRIKFPEDLRHNEDFVFVTRFLSLGLPVGFYNIKGYNYIHHPASVTRSANISRLLLDQSVSTKYILEILKNAWLDDDLKKWYAKRLCWNLWGDWRVLHSLDEAHRKSYIEQLHLLLPMFCARFKSAVLPVERFLIKRLSAHPERMFTFPLFYYWPLRAVMQIKAKFAKDS